ncbi:MAG: FAD/NAD(P)-binding protein [Candidatus Marinimicrobia bacterium]|nr:FAD/NAD(P)-binding protein [Candidatus Neomarinimicrobiota bacterium]
MDTVLAKEKKILYAPEISEIIEAKFLTATEKFFKIKLPGGRDLKHIPGQFVQVSLFGVGEAPISVCSSPTQKGFFELTIRKVGMLTEKIHELEAGDKIGIRGPYGRGFDVNAFKGKDILIIGGGIGIVPLRSLINYIIDNRNDYGRLIILYGAKSPSELLYRDELKMWEEREDIEYHVTVDRSDENWKGNVGVITTLIPPLELDLENTIAAIVGPPVMYKFVLLALKSKRFPEKNIYMSLERRMKCGVGKCGHCQINNLYVCQDGPVFNYLEVKGLEEAI